MRQRAHLASQALARTFARFIPFRAPSQTPPAPLAVEQLPRFRRKTIPSKMQPLRPALGFADLKRLPEGTYIMAMFFYVQDGGRMTYGSTLLPWKIIKHEADGSISFALMAYPDAFKKSPATMRLRAETFKRWPLPPMLLADDKEIAAATTAWEEAWNGRAMLGQV